MKLASFDIFDTVLIRKCGLAENIFYLLSKRLYPNNSSKQRSFYLWRCSAENIARKSIFNDLTIEDIYSTLDVNYYKEFSLDVIIKNEYEVERKMLSPNPHVASIITEYRSKKYHIAFISDMYLSSIFIKDILREFNLFEKDDHIYVSSEYNARKSTGELYDLVKCQLKPQDWIHHGDNLHSDIKQARKKGIRTCIIDSGYSPVENRLISLSNLFAESSNLSILSGLCRFERIKGNNSFDAIAADYLTPIYVPYLFFIKEFVRKRGIKRLYFLSRDSYILMKGYEVIEDNNVDIKYFFVSRKALIRPFFYVSSKEDYINIFDGNTLKGKSVYNLLSDLGLNHEDSKSFADFIGFDKIVDKDTETSFLNALYESPYSETIKKNTKHEYDLFHEYVYQEGLLEDCESAFVDVGWLGTSRIMINKILNKSNQCAIPFLYFSVRKDVLRSSFGEFIYYLKPGYGSLTAFIEQYFSECPFPSTIGYTKTKDRIEPVFQNGESYYRSEILNSNETVLLHYLSILKELPIASNDTMMALCYNSINSLMTFKDKIDLSAFTKISSSKHEKVILRKLSALDTLKLLLGKDVGLDHVNASLVYTYGRKMSIYILSVKDKIGKIKSFIKNVR